MLAIHNFNYQVTLNTINYVVNLMCEFLTFQRFATSMFVVYHILLDYLWYLVPQNIIGKQSKLHD